MRIQFEKWRKHHIRRSFCTVYTTYYPRFKATRKKSRKKPAAFKKNTAGFVIKHGGLFFRGRPCFFRCQSLSENRQLLLRNISLRLIIKYLKRCGKNLPYAKINGKESMAVRSFFVFLHPVLKWKNLNKKI